MNTFINLVATRSKDGDHAALFRWYNDHVHLLMGFPALLQASLYRRAGDADPDAPAPEYVCLYEFPGRADFEAFELSAARALAREVVETGWAREGIEITQRTQYLRLGRRSGLGDQPLSATEHGFQCLSLGAGPPAEVARWLGDRLHDTVDLATTASLAWHRAADATAAGGDALVHVQAAIPRHAASVPLAGAWWEPAAPGAAYGTAPGAVALRWHGAYQRLCCWTR